MNAIPRTIRLALTALFLLPPLAFANAVPEEPAPAFRATDASGESHTLTDYIGGWLVLEWFNKDCPYVKKHYSSGNMQRLQKKYTDEDVTWLTVISSAEGKEGYLEPEEALTVAEEYNLSASAPFLLDTAGVMGRAYGAKVTPHIYVIDPHGMVVYAGAIDDNDSANPEATPDSEDYVVTALDAAMNEEEVEVTTTQAYGCPVEY